MFPIITNALNFVRQGSFDRSIFAFKATWNRTYFCAVVCLVMLVLSTLCALLIADPLLASGLLDHVYQPKGIIVGVVLCLVMYTVRDFLVAYHSDIVMNQRIAQANNWLRYGSYVVRTSAGTQTCSMGQALMLASRAKDSEDGLHVSCIVVADGVPTLVTVRVDSACTVIGEGIIDEDQIRSMLEDAAGEWRYDVAEQIGLTFGKHAPMGATPDDKPERPARRTEKHSGPLSTPGSLSLTGSGAKH